MACNNALPTKANFLKRKIVKDRSAIYVLFVGWRCRLRGIYYGVVGRQEIHGICVGGRYKNSFLKSEEFIHNCEGYAEQLDEEDVELMAVVARN